MEKYDTIIPKCIHIIKSHNNIVSQSLQKFCEPPKIFLNSGKKFLLTKTFSFFFTYGHVLIFEDYEIKITLTTILLNPTS